MQDLTFRVLEKTIFFSDDQREGEKNVHIDCGLPLY